MVPPMPLLDKCFPCELSNRVDKSPNKGIMDCTRIMLHLTALSSTVCSTEPWKNEEC